MTQRVAVAGAGAFGGWIALHLARRGCTVTLVDPWGPANTRASSGDETRIVRANYGKHTQYVGLGARALELWPDFEQERGIRLIERTGMLWMESDPDEAYKASWPLLDAAGIAYEVFTPEETARRYPQINIEGMLYAHFEHGAGYAYARRACNAVFEAFLEAGGSYVQAGVAPVLEQGGALDRVALHDGQRIAADTFIFACGPWLGQVLPEALGHLITPTRQEIFYFGEPAGNSPFHEAHLPVWVDHRDLFFYGIPGNERRGFKVGDDRRGDPAEPTTMERAATPEWSARTRAYLEERFPGMKGAPITEARVCQYENTPDNDFILDRHPCLENVWVAGGGSGHGFKHGPAIGEYLSGVVLDGTPVRPEFGFARFAL
ncbi:MAG: FAD-dependent oxidoreductase [Candidatus Hydrogenedentes bacterium]|nr:FAD-dependent oxidoreductase [Candidatus Hydrogenedentota bacterium]